MDGLLFFLRHLLVLALLAASLFVSGRMALRRFVFDSVAEELSTSIGLGYGLVGTWLFLLCALHVLYAGVLWGSLAALHILGWPVWRDVFDRIRRFQERGLS